jgi:hypothetical protein
MQEPEPVQRMRRVSGILYEQASQLPQIEQRIFDLLGIDKLARERCVGSAGDILHNVRRGMNTLSGFQVIDIRAREARGLRELPLRHAALLPIVCDEMSEIRAALRHASFLPFRVSYLLIMPQKMLAGNVFIFLKVPYN